MNLNNTIYFDGEDLTVGRPARIIYKGFLCQSNPEQIIMHCGYGLLWEGLQEIQLERGIDGYEADVTFINADEVYFCFRDSNGTWDNNNGQNYFISVQKPVLSLAKKDTSLLPEVPKLKKIYYIQKKIKVAFYKTITFIGKLLTGNIDYFIKKRKGKENI